MNLTIFLLLLIIISIGVISSSSIIIINDVANSEIDRKLQELTITTKHFSQILSIDLNERISDVELLASTNGPLYHTHISEKEKLDYLLLFLANYVNYDSVSVYDKNGLKTVDSRNLGIGSDISETDFFKNTIKYTNYHDPSPIFYDPLERTAISGSLSIIRYSSVLFDNSGDFNGIVVASYSLTRTFHEIVSGADEAYQLEIANRDGFSYVHTKNYFEESPEYHAYYEGITYDGDSVVVFSSIPSFGKYVENPNMSFILKTNTNNLFQNIYERQLQLQLITLFSTVIVIIISIFLMRKFHFELINVSNLLSQMVNHQQLNKIKYYFSEMSNLESKIISSNKLLIKSEKANKEKLLVFEEIIKITKLISKGDLSQKMNVGKIKSNEIRELQKNINFAIDQLSKVESDRASFSAMITHELKTPLVPIKGYAQMLKKEKYGKLTLFQKEAINEIERSSNVLYNLIENILTAQKLDSGNIKMTSIHMSSSKLIDLVYLSLSPLMQDKNIKFNKITYTDEVVLIDFEKILEVFVNLVQNSVDFVSSIDGIISIICSKSDDGVLFSVEDNGEGIPLSDQQNLFKKYYQVDTSVSRKHGGSGLGLAICKGIVETMGGKIWVKSIIGKGSTFYFSIPSSE
jgi:signal transduction histidine kinase